MAMTRSDVVLELRFRGHDDADIPPDVAAFCGSARERATALHEAAEQIGVLPGAPALAPQASVVVFFQHAVFPIPAPGETRDGTRELASWSLRATAFGWLAEVTPARRSFARPRASWVIAACFPMAFAAASEAAAAPLEKPAAVQRPKKPRATASPTVTEPAVEPVAEPPVEPTPTPEPTPDAPPTDPFEATTPSTEEPPAPLPPRAGGPDPAIVDAAWEGVDGFDVEVQLKGDRTLRGKVGAVQKDTFTLIQAETGAVLVLPKSGVLSLRARTPGPLPDRTGVGLIAGGVVLTTIATPVFLTGVVFLGVCPSCTYIHLPMLLVGAAALGGGIPMIVRGARFRRAYNRALQERQLSFAVAPTKGGWSGGLRFRF